jgi:uncharacterized membrane protein YdbT with pleckstrin-like domain
MTRDFSPRGEGRKPMQDVAEERVWLDARRHAIVLARPFAKAGFVAAVGGALLVVGWPVSAAGSVLLGAAALVALGAVVRWDHTHVVVTDEKLFVVHGIVRRRAAAVRLARIGAVELDQSLLGRILGYGTICAGELEIPYVPGPREVCGLMQRLAA